jgi:small conductance mechanosensitive channel
MKRTIVLLLLTAAAVILTPPIAPAQDEAKASAPAATPAPEAVTATDPEIPVEVLTKLLRAPTRDELAVEAEAWRDLLRQNIDSIAQAEIASLSEKVEEIAESDAAEAAVAADDTASGEALNDQMVALTEQKTGLIQRFGIVLDAFEKKGGDAAEYRSYADAVSEIQIEVKDVSATWAALRGWLTSKEGGIKWGIQALKFCAILFVFWILAAVIGRVVRKATSMHRDMSDLLRRFLNNLVRRAVLLAGFLIALSSLGISACLATLPSPARSSCCTCSAVDAIA